MQARRHQYLNAMGIQVWQLRDQAPAAEAVVGAGISTTFEQPLELEVTVTNESSLTAASFDTDNAPSTSPLSAQPEKVTAAEAVPGNPEFRLASVIFPGNCMVVTQVTAKSGDPLSHRQLSLLKNILSSIEVKLLEEPVVTFFSWPMLRSPGFDQGETAARQACQAFLNGLRSKHSLSFVLLMGETAGRYLTPGFESFASARGRLYTEMDSPLLLTDSIDRLTTEPCQKATLWRDIQPLRQCLDQP